MLKRFENLGTALNRNQSKAVVGGNLSASATELQIDLLDSNEATCGDYCVDNSNCISGTTCKSVACGTNQCQLICAW